METLVGVTSALARAGAVVRDGKVPARGEAGALEIDIWLPRSRQRAASRVLRAEGFHEFPVPGQIGHRFWLTYRDGWVKVDAKLTPAVEAGRWRRALARRRPAGWRRLGPVVAFVGPDGAGKSTIIRGVREDLPVATTVVYLGSRRRSTSGARPRSVRTRPRRGVRHRIALAREPLFVVVKALRLVPALVRAWVDAWRGRVILCDRHPLEALVTEGRHTRVGLALERLLATRVLPAPDRILLVDAEPESMYGRKAEHDLARLTAWRDAYHRVLVPKGAAIVSTEGSYDDSLRAASVHVWEAMCERRRWSIQTPVPIRADGAGRPSRGLRRRRAH